MEENENFIHNKYGYCYYAINPNNTALIFNLYIDYIYRRKGHAKHLIQLIIREINIVGCKRIYIKAEPQEDSITLENLISFYKRMGLKII
jgi:GNAT superfamily N-acetyltransferase